VKIAASAEEAAMVEDEVVYIVEDDEAQRHALAVMLETCGRTVRAFASAPEFLTAAPKLRPGCLTTDIQMPDMTGLELQACLIERSLIFPLIIITGHGDVSLAVRAMKAGAVDFIEKPILSEAIQNSIDAALARLTQPREHDLLVAAAVARLGSLTPRELEVLERILGGFPNKSIARDLKISPRTVEVHRARVMEKMRARSLSELVRMGLGAGLIPLFADEARAVRI
jgi:two-component system, LuxR family, response regulator FixJ